MICRGAEGTVVENGDLATKVWGLGSDEGHRLRPKSPQPLRSSVSCAPSSLDDNIIYQRVTSSAMARHRDAVIDLVKPLYCYTEAYETAGRQLVSIDGTYSSPAGHLGRPNFCGYAPTSQDVRSNNVATVSTKVLPDQTALGKEQLARNRALAQTLPPTRQSSLNSAAPSFVPAYHIENADHDVGFGDFKYSHPGRDSATLGQQYAYELTPSSSASSLWSPVFQSVPTIVWGDYNPRIYSPQA
jgi:hypothetical protein